MNLRAKRLVQRLKRLKVTPEDKYYFSKYGKLVAKLRRDPVFQARILHGIVVPPHQRVILRSLRYPQYNEHHIVGSRGVSKSFTVASVHPVLYSEVYGRKKVSSLSASKFRGGKVIMEEALSFIQGNLDSQKKPGRQAEEMLDYRKGLKREGDRWYIQFKTKTTFSTIPTGNEESARGLRANHLVLDEADNWDKDTVDRIFGPFLAVAGNFEAPASEESGNSIYFTGTVSYSHKDWAKALKDRENLIRKAQTAYKALESGDFDTWDRLSSEDNERIKRNSVNLMRWDYTDLLIPTKINNHAIVYPYVNRASESLEINPPEIIAWDTRDKCNYIRTYPVDKEYAEKQLDDGLTDFDSWAAEWRCQFIDTSGNVYPFELIERSTNTELLDVKDLRERGWDPEDLGPYFPPVLFECSDPCVLGVDPARTDDFTAFVVIRLGELAEGPYDPLTGTGNTSWNNVIWAEQRKNMTIKDIAEKIRELKSRYNLHVYKNPVKAPGVVIDARGAASGTTVRDELALPSPPVDEFGNTNPNWSSPNPYYDPTDKEYQHLRANPEAWPGLRLFWATDTLNTQLVSYSKGQLEVSKLFLGRFLNSVERNDPQGRLNLGYIGVKTLKDQLLSIQGEPTKHAFKYSMPGDSRRVDMKKDLFSAFLYANHAAREHIAAASVKINSGPPPMAAVKVNMNRRKLDRRVY